MTNLLRIRIISTSGEDPKLGTWTPTSPMIFDGKSEVKQWSISCKNAVLCHCIAFRFRQSLQVFQPQELSNMWTVPVNPQLI